jgi:hypothetical protein
MNLEMFKINDPSGKMSKESYVLNNHREEYGYITSTLNIDIPFKEKVYLVINGLSEVPKCNNPNCQNNVKFKNSTLGYLKYCSNKCMGSDPDIIMKKQKKSIEKYGTKTPAESDIIKEKTKTTNNLKYGGNSAMSSDEIKNKSKETLIKNWGVDNPSKSVDILEKRVKSFKENIDTYKKSYERTSIEKYGVKHPWMNKNIHDKTIEHFYKDYKERIIESIGNDFEFLGFEKNISTNLKFNCKKCSTNFDILPYQFYFRINNSINICTNCFPISENSSITQIELYNFIKENYSGEIIQNDKKTIKPYEIDIYLPELRIGFEFNGVFWHSTKFKDNNYHLKKYNSSIENGVKLYTIWEDDWNLKRDICKSFVLNKVSKSTKIMGRKTKVTEVDYPTSKKFLDENHLQGDCKSSVRLGLYQNEELVSLMTFSKLRLPIGGKNTEGIYELTRFCNRRFYSIIGGASKLINYFKQKYSPNEIQTYSDNLISNGQLYENLKFEYSHTSDPGYWYVIDGIRSHRYNWRKQKLVEMGYDKNKTENEIMLELGYYKIYNAGNKKWIWKK